MKSRKYRFENLDIFENLEFHPVKIGVRRFENIVLNVWFSFSDVQAFENLICKYFKDLRKVFKLFPDVQDFQNLSVRIDCAVI